MNELCQTIIDFDEALDVKLKNLRAKAKAAFLKDLDLVLKNLRWSETVTQLSQYKWQFNYIPDIRNHPFSVPETMRLLNEQLAQKQNEFIQQCKIEHDKIEAAICTQIGKGKLDKNILEWFNDANWMNRDNWQAYYKQFNKITKQAKIKTRRLEKVIQKKHRAELILLEIDDFGNEDMAAWLPRIKTDLELSDDQWERILQEVRIRHTFSIVLEKQRVIPKQKCFEKKRIAPKKQKKHVMIGGVLGVILIALASFQIVQQDFDITIREARRQKEESEYAKDIALIESLWENIKNVLILEPTTITSFSKLRELDIGTLNHKQIRDINILFIAYIIYIETYVKKNKKTNTAALHLSVVRLGIGVLFYLDRIPGVKREEILRQAGFASTAFVYHIGTMNNKLNGIFIDRNPNEWTQFALLIDGCRSLVSFFEKEYGDWIVRHFFQKKEMDSYLSQWNSSANFHVNRLFNLTRDKERNCIGDYFPNELDVRNDVLQIFSLLDQKNIVAAKALFLEIAPRKEDIPPKVLQQLQTQLQMKI